MPGIEVFTISGALFGAGLSPDGGAYTPDDEPAAPTQTALVPHAPAAPAANSSYVSPPAQLQNALRALGVTAGDPALMAVSVDGIVGPKTVTAVNVALSKYIGATPQFPRANLTATQVRQYAGSLAALVSERVRKSGGVVPPPVVRKPVRHSATSSFVAQAIPTSPGFHFDRRWLWWAVGGAGLLVVLSAAASAARKRREEAKK